MKKNILTVNCGSTSVKYKLFDYNKKVLDEVFINTKNLKDKIKEKKFLKKIGQEKENLKIGFRVVAGGPNVGPLKINSKLKKEIQKYTIFAPIHNKVVLEKINQIEKLFPKSDLYAVFDTDFHRTISKEFSTYPVDQKIAQKYHLKKYGYHGLAIESSLQNLNEVYKKKKEKLPLKIIFLHLGGGASVTFVKNKKSFLTSMELTPVSGLMMTTRAGNIDSDFDIILSKLSGKSISKVSEMISKKSGFYGLTGSKDTEKIFDKYILEKKQKKGKYKNEKLACDIFLNQIAGFIYQYAGLGGGVDLIVLEGGIGKNNIYIKNEIKKRLKTFGLNKIPIVQTKIFEEELIFDKIKRF
ncbi:hypothetical protein CSB11_00590 [Candidatus Campbellbacteria bacterium]|nr:MAG: hypothetical protein CSB11_00590 [Candidatus Campbellbacteria bacterium]